ncbi:signal peptidase I [Enterococcus crotali]|uniref:signal peptidase I n=1 Tax=Enterococcus crotali TaxID=1453587 RepID=UPI00046FCACA|nr:signal peptidase I [Enterococcus crotali]
MEQDNKKKKQRPVTKTTKSTSKKKTNQLSKKQNKDSSRERTKSSIKVKSQKKRKLQKVKRKKLTKKQRIALKKQQHKKLILEVIITILLTLTLTSIIAYFTFSIPKVEGYSMTPTVNDKDRLFVNKWGQVKRFNLIYFKEPKHQEVMIRRVIALPGEDFFYKEGKLYIDGEEIVERFMSQTTEANGEKQTNRTPDFSLREIVQAKRVPKGKYVVLGDNRSYSTDSRYFGLVDEKDIIGVVTMRVFPIHEMTHF